jgi:uncharacterized phage protein gp47/JayE
MFNRPSLSELINRIREDVLSRITDDDPLRRSDAEVYARVLAGAGNELYGYLDWLAANVIYDTADDDMLQRWAAIWGITPVAASFSIGTATFSGSNGAIIPADSILQAYDQVQYTVNADVTVASGTAVAAITAIIAGVAGNRTTGQSFNLISPIAGVQSVATASALTGGADIEGSDGLRSRFLARIRQPPHGGASFDYVAWALEVSGFTRAWCYPQELGLGTVTIRGMCDFSYADGIPLSGDVAALQAHIDALRPVTATAYCVAPVADVLNFTIAALVPSTLAVENAIIAALQELIVAESYPGGTLLISHIRAAISGATGEYDYSLTSPAANVTHGTGHIATMGTVTWV